MTDLKPLIHWFEHLTPDTLDQLPQFYAADAEFKDPFNDVRGVESIQHIFRHMFSQVAEPHFVVGSRFSGEGDEGGVMLLWDFHFRTLARRPQAICVRGASHLRFDASGKVVLHRDYWDAAGELYAKLPLIGGIMRGLQRMGQA